ncbi:GlxA family transcriptional regulator [Paraburkholderia saeva]|uniref:GlxA family transcriptional regulator n=1 Tax=Paraburkholderia saeva TaxID=2777537 RepID=UPI001D37C422|nr:AraC family transcriptional regulator [Paraburkholderia saeva]CAG4920310.1 HTH-type transcriptional activator RhaS [Paraburkholderia saeva]
MNASVTPALPVRHVVIAVAPDLVLLDACGPLEAFWRAELTLAETRPDAVRQAAVSSATGMQARAPVAYRVTVASIEGGVLQTFPGLPVVTQRLDTLEDEPIDTLIVPGVPIDERIALQPELVAWIARRAPAVRRVCSVCTGAFYLAAAGLLDGRRATTHWRDAELLARHFPKVKVDADPIFIRDARDLREAGDASAHRAATDARNGCDGRGGQGAGTAAHDGETPDSRQTHAIWTSAGVTAGIDLALALIEEDVGHAIAMQAARRLVVFMKRPGGQSQFSAALAAQASAGGPFDALHSWMAVNLRDDLSVERLAGEARMSPRTFARRYVEEVGRTPAKTVSSMRLEAAARSLAASRSPLKRIALDCGFGSEQNLRRAFMRRFGVLPLDYRERFASAP